MNSKWIYSIIAVLAIVAVIYPVSFAYLGNLGASDNPYMCAPMIPCQQQSGGFENCQVSCVIYMKDSTFSPGTVNASAGAKITWINKDYVAHTSTTFNGSGWDSPIIPAGASFTLVLPSNLSPGSYYYHCNVHPAMIGLINIVPSTKS